METRKSKISEGSKKGSKDRQVKFRDRLSEKGIKRVELHFHEDIVKELDKLVELSGYKKNKREMLKGRSALLTQIIHNVWTHNSEYEFDRTGQEGLVLTRILESLKGKGKASNTMKKYVPRVSPSDFLDTEETEWSVQLLQDVIKRYAQECDDN